MKRQRGSVIFGVLPLALLAAGFIFLSLTSTVVDLRQQELRIHRKRALHRAESSLAVAQAKIKTSAYDARGNVVLRDAIESGADMGVQTAGGKTVRELHIGEFDEVWCSEIDDGLFQLDAIARVGRVTKQMRCLVRERDSFSRYTLFINSASVNLGGAATTGWMHTNRKVTFYYAGHTYPTVTARDGFYYAWGATEANTTIAADSNAAADEIAMPDLGAIQARAVHSDGALDTLLNGSDASNYRIHLELKGDGYEFKAHHKTTGAILSTGTLPMPASGVIYVDGDLEGLQGTLSSRATLAVTGKVQITGNIQYVDDEGDTAYRNGLPADPDDPYEPNPAYDGSAVLGVMAGGNVTYSDAAPNQLEINAYFFSKGMFGVPQSSYGKRDTLRILGGHTVETGVIGAYVSGNGTVAAGFRNRNYTFDGRLANEPPPHFLALDEPRFGAYRVVDGPAIGSREADGFPLFDVAIGAKARAKNGGNGGVGNGKGNGATNGNGNGVGP